MNSDIESNLINDDVWPLHPADMEAMSWALAAKVDVLRRVEQSYRTADMAIHANDEMWSGLIQGAPKEQIPYVRLHYTYGGRSAMRSIGNAIIAAEQPVPKRILDFPSSHGRVTRFLVKAFPEAEVIAGDVNREGVDFCAARFGAKPFYSSHDLGDVKLPTDLDLIWCSSLVTHLKLDRCKQLFNMFIDSLAPNGIAGVTWCGRGMDYAHDHVFKTIDDESMAAIRQQVKDRGAGYAPYPRWPNDEYGMTFVTPAWLQELVYSRGDALILSYSEKNWHGTQDTLWMIKRPLSHWYDWARDD